MQCQDEPAKEGFNVHQMTSKRTVHFWVNDTKTEEKLKLWLKTIPLAQVEAEIYRLT